MDILTFLYTYTEDPWKGIKEKEKKKGIKKRGIKFINITNLKYFKNQPLYTLLSVVNKLQSLKSLILKILLPFL